LANEPVAPRQQAEKALATAPEPKLIMFAAVMNEITRRSFLGQTAVAAFASAASLSRLSAFAEARKRKMTIDLVCGNFGVSASQPETIELAARHGFESVGVDGAALAKMSDDQIAGLKATMKDKGIVFGAAGLPVEFRREETQFEQGLKELPKFASGLQRAGVGRVATWLMPGHSTLPYLQNFRQHATRLRKVAETLKGQGIRLGLEYVGPRTSWTSLRYPFIHTLGEMGDLIAEINTGNVGYLLDSWHWWHAGDTVADLLALKANDVIAVDLNDAPAGIAKEQMPDGRRELPCATGVIDVGPFLNALNGIGYDGPVRAEPFNQALSKLPKEDACAAVASAMHKAFALVK